ncbi:uncharacterized protein AC631_02976 [Debaryomyces fabryi]|uniref:RRM domain-containing protein n=1 Tax=Debaryomyces fabryi TaxID=58627 RepID=A0A0V1PYH2_9ASCO|nr:uncharacterized protein AC631_02976 [Debaryomyces fabryi]KSA01280.1 hypothetical protein AC631_02976 [Debaryomyces fabryi]
MASISVPIEKHKQSLYSKDPFGNSHQSGGFGGHSYSRLSGLHDNGPPYIVKLLNLPITSNESFIEDLFKSRFTSFVKFKIVVDPSSNILETHVIKKVAFVELESFQEMNKVLKWQDLYYKATRRVVVELADFHDFQHCIAFNQEHEREIQEIQDDFIKQKQSQHFGHGGFDQPRNININSPPRKHQPLNSHATSILQPSLSERKPSMPQEGSVGPPTAAPQKNKPNPFGAAKPVDVLAKLHEIDKKLITINHTTIKTLGPMADDIDLGHHDSTGKQASSEPTHVPHERRMSQKDSRRTSVNILKRPSPSTSQNVPSAESHPELKEAEKSQLTKAPIPESIYSPKDNNKSLAELLSKNENPSPPKGRSTPKSIKNSPKPSTNKPVILKKKPQTPAVDLTVKESEFSSNVENTAASKELENGAKDKEIEDKLKEINSSLSRNNKMEIINKSPANGSGKPKEATSDQKRSRQTYNKVNENQSMSVPEENKKPVETQVSSQEAERAKDRPNFKKHFAELSKRQNAQREKVQTPQNTRFSSHSQASNNKKNGANYKRHIPKELGLSIDKVAVTSNQNTADSKNTATKSNVNGDVSKEDRGIGARGTGRNKSRFSGRDKSTDLPKKDVKNIEEVKSRKLQANFKGNNKNGRKSKETNNSDQIEALNGSKDMNDAKDPKERKYVKIVQDVKNVRDVKNVKDVKDLKEAKVAKSEVLSKVLNNSTVSNEKGSKTPEMIEKDVKSDPSNGLASSSTGGKQSISDSVDSKADVTKSDVLSENVSTTSNRGRARGGRGKGRGGFRGSVRGMRGARGRGNFNLHYVRSKDDKAES